MPKELSAGGLVLARERVLVIKVTNLKGEVVWTFPKGHLEPGEDSRGAALREVQEETGWSCRILAPLSTARYHFRRAGRTVAKSVDWFLMTPLKKAGRRDPAEIMAVRWAPLATVRRLLRYASDFELLEAYGRRPDARRAGPERP